MKIPYKAIHLEDAEIFSLEGIHKKYWKDFCDTYHTRIGFSPKIEGDDSYENRFLNFKVFRIVKAEFLKWDIVMNWAVKEDDFERFKMAFNFFCKLETQDKAAMPMLLVLLRMQQSISDRLKDDVDENGFVKDLEFYYPISPSAAIMISQNAQLEEFSEIIADESFVENKNKKMCENASLFIFANNEKILQRIMMSRTGD